MTPTASVRQTHTLNIKTHFPGLFFPSISFSYFPSHFISSAQSLSVQHFPLFHTTHWYLAVLLVFLPPLLLWLMCHHQIPPPVNYQILNPKIFKPVIFFFSFLCHLIGWEEAVEGKKRGRTILSEVSMETVKQQQQGTEETDGSAQWL